MNLITKPGKSIFAFIINKAEGDVGIGLEICCSSDLEKRHLIDIRTIGIIEL